MPEPTQSELVKLYGDKTIIYGTSSLKLKDKVGYVQSCTFDGDMPDSTVEGESGEIVAHIAAAGNVKKSATITAVIAGGVKPPEEGDAFEVPTEEYSGIVMGVSKAFENKGAVKITIKTSGYKNINYKE